jgi:hypothetical protein
MLGYSDIRLMFENNERTFTYDLFSNLKHQTYGKLKYNYCCGICQKTRTF